MKKTLKNQSGAAMTIVVLFFALASATITTGIISPIARDFKTNHAKLKSEQSYFLAESGIEDAFYRIKNNITIDTTETLVLGDSSSTSIISTINTNQKQINSTGQMDSYERNLGLTITQDTGVSFNYGVQVGRGGINLTGSAKIKGNVYANGPITGDGSASITGSATSANSPTTADQYNGEGTPTYDISVGNTSNTDIAQSFKLTTTAQLSKVQLYLKKTGNPYNTTVYILPNNGSNPGFGSLAQGTLSSSQVSTSYGWVDISFTTNPTLTAGTTYWIVMTTTSGGGYYSAGGNNAGYIPGASKKGAVFGAWSNLSPSTLDFYFNVFLSSINGRIAGNSGSQWNQFRVGTTSGDARANTVNYTNVTGSLYCQSGTGNNKICNTTQADPAYQEFPISEGNIEEWKQEALAGGTHNGNYDVSGSNTATLGPKKIVGNLTVGGSGTLYVSGTLWVTGNITLSGSGKIVLASASYGNSSGIIITDGKFDNGGSGQVNGTGQNGSYVLMIALSNCDSATCGYNAINVSGSAGSVVLYAPYGTINFSGSAKAKEATGYRVTLSGSAEVEYESGLADMNFNSGPSGSWTPSGWSETE